MHTGESLLMRGPEDLPAYPVPLQIPGAGDEDAASAIFVPLRFGPRPIGVLPVQSSKRRAYDENDLQLLETCALYVAVAVQPEFTKSNDEREDEIITVDPVTGAATRRYFDERLNLEWNRARRTGISLAVILMDIDRFKALNETYGRAAGDSCLVQVAQAARSCFARSGDLFARYGGGAFAAILPDVPAAAALAIAERMRSAVCALQIPHSEHAGGTLTASFGVACSVALLDDARPLVRRAEHALSMAKTGSGNRVALDTPAIADESPQLSGNLPPREVESVGRRIELDALTRSLALSRLTTVVGRAGVGKTHCALSVAHQLRHAYVHGAWFFDLSLVRDEHELNAAVGAGIDARLAAHRYPRDAIVHFFAHKHCLVVFDRCERVIPQVSDLCEVLLSRAPRTTILTTSRAGLKITHERVFHLSPLTREDAEALFCAHASHASTGTIFDAEERMQIRQVCEQLGDVPLAIELAAPRIQRLAPAQIAANLGDRAHTLDDAISWSYDLLDERAQRLFERLSVFANTFDSDAARDICGFVPLRPGEAAAAFDELVETRLLAPVPMPQHRYVLPGSMRAFAAQRLRERGEDALMYGRHSRYFLACAQRLSEQIAGEWAEFRVALKRSFADEAQFDTAYALVLSLCDWWLQSGRTNEARAWIQRALNCAGVTDPHRIELLAAAARTAQYDGDFVALREHASEMLALAESSEARSKLGGACNALGNAERHLGNAKAAVQWFTSALAHYRACGEGRGVGVVLMDLGAAAADLDLDFVRARTYFLEALGIFQQLGLTSDVGIALANLGAIAGQMSDYETAIGYALESLSVFERISSPCAQAWQLVSIAHYRIERQEWERATAALRNAHAILQEHPHREYGAMLLEVGLYLAGDLRRDDLAARIAGYLHAYRERERVPRLPSAQRHYDGRVQRARRRLGTHAFEAAYASGAATAPDALLAEIVRA